MKLVPRLGFQPSALAALLLSLLLAGPALAQDRLPSWNDGKTKQAIVDFVKKVTATGSAEFVPPAPADRRLRQRRTLWTEHRYTSARLALDRVKALAPSTPSGRTRAVQGGARGRHEGAGRSGEGGRRDPHGHHAA
jgi:hypothetical protein